MAEDQGTIPFFDYLKQYAAKMQEAGLPTASLDYEFITRHGQEYKARILPRRFKMQMPKQCFGNTYRLVHRAKSLRYVEGYIDYKGSRILPMHHAWAIDKNDRVVDVTINNPLNWEYCGVAISNEQLANHFHPNGFGVFDIGSGINYKYFLEVDPTLLDLLPPLVAEHLALRFLSRNNPA